MNKKCKCGGKMRFHSETANYFEYQCSDCLVIRRQRKRKAKANIN